ncbi:MAG: hypothetical protein R3F56_22960 [Planctomycetota bacterium]
MTTAVLQPLLRLRSRARFGIVVEAAGTLAIAAGVFVVASYVLDRTFRLETAYRAALLAVLALVAARLVAKRLLRPLRVRLSDDELALAVERSDPPLRQALISAVQFSRAPGRHGESAQMREHVVGDVVTRVRAIPFGAALDRRRALRYGALVAALLAGILTWIAVDRGTFELWFKRNVLLSALEWPRSTLLRFVDPVQRLPQGDDLTLRVVASGVVPEQVRLAYRFVGGERGSEPMTLTGDVEFRVTLTAMLEGLTVQATGGDGETDELHIEIVQRPAITDLQVRVEAPAYVGEAGIAAADADDLRLLRGSKLALTARSDKEVREAFLLVGEADKVPLTVDADRHTLRGELVPTQTGAVVVDVVDQDRLGAKTPPRLYVRVLDDQAPSVDVRLVGIGSMVTAVARIPADLTVRDDFGLAEVTAWHRISGKPTAPSPEVPPEGVQPNEAPGAEPAAPEEPVADFAPVTATGLETFAAGERELRTQVVVDLRDLGKAQPGHMLALRFDAKDNFGLGEPHVTQGEPVVFRVVTAEELAADLQRRQLEQRKLLEAVLSQEETARAQLAETIDPSSDDPRAAQAKQKLLQLAKTERELGARCGSIGETYAQILDEATNNRIAQAAELRTLRERVVQPLGALAAGEFPQAAAATEAYAAAGQDDLKVVAVATYDTVIQRIRSILANMEREERLAAVIAALQEVIKLEKEAADEASKRRGEAGSEVFGPGRDDTVPSPPDRGDKK